MKVVIQKLQEWLAGAGLAALAPLTPTERGVSTLSFYLARMLMDQGKLDQAEPLLREAIEVRREMLGDKHYETLLSVNMLLASSTSVGCSH